MALVISQVDLDFILLQLRLPNNTPLMPLDMTGIRDTQGVGNNVLNPSWGAADTPFIRALTPQFIDAQQITGRGPTTQLTPSNYAVRDINLVDSSTRIISNLIADQSAESMAARGYTPEEARLALLDDPTTTPVGRVSPLTGDVNPLVYSGFLSIMGQFFDHGLSFVKKGADGTVYTQLQPGDPLYVDPTSAAYVPGLSNIMMASRTNTVHVDVGQASTDSLVTALGLTQQRYTNANATLNVGEPIVLNGIPRETTYVLGANIATGTFGGVLKLNNTAIDIAPGSTGAQLIDAINAQSPYTGLTASMHTNGQLKLSYVEGESINTVSPFIDLSQSYGSDPSHTAFIREYIQAGIGQFETTGRLVSGGASKDGNLSPDGMATWADIKANALIVGVKLHDKDVLDIPEVRLTVSGSPYFGTGNAAGMWLVARDTVTGAIYYVKDSLISANTTALNANNQLITLQGSGLNLELQKIGHAFLDDMAHHVGDALQPRGGPAAVDLVPGSQASIDLNKHQISGDGRTVENIALTAIHDIFHSEHNNVLKTIIALNQERIDTDAGYKPMTGEELFQAAKLVTEMEYQHMIFGEFARKLSPNIGGFAGYDATANPGITAEFAHAVYRFGHSMLTETVDTAVLVNGARTTSYIPLFDAFLNPDMYQALDTDANNASAASELVTGMSNQVGNAIDQWVTDTLRNALVTLPLDLANLNLQRGRDTGMPSLNDARAMFFAQTGMTSLKPYADWTEFGNNLIHPETVVDFIAAYAYDAIQGFAGADARAKATTALSNQAFMDGNAGLNNIDLWIGGLAEQKVTGGMLGSTFDFVFASQLMALQAHDRMYYLGRLAGTELLAEIETQFMSDIAMRNTGATHLYSDIFSVADKNIELATFTGPMHTFLNKAAGFDSKGVFWGNKGDYTDARGVLNPNGTGNASEMIGGTSGVDKINSAGGNDTVWGDGGNDSIDGGLGNDFLHGGDGDDYVADLGGDDLLWGDAGNDTVNGGLGLDQVFGGAGNDVLYGSDGDDIVDAGTGNDLVFGDNGHVIAPVNEPVQYIAFNRTNGTATIVSPLVAPVNTADITYVVVNGVMDSNGGSDLLGGGAGNDVIFGGGGADALDGAAGNDTLIGGGGADGFVGAEGDDFFLMDAGSFAFNNAIDGGLGFDTVSYQLTRSAVTVSLANAGLALVPPGTNVLDSFIGVEGLIGSEYNDLLVGGLEDNVIQGLGGNDTIDGGLGMDMVSYSNVKNGVGVQVNLEFSPQGNTASLAGSDTLISIEGAIGTIYADRLTGNAFDNTFQGLAGNDSISGGAGSDTVSYVEAVNSVTINLGIGLQAINAEVGRDTLTSIENVIGGFGADTLTGNGGNNIIDGGIYAGPVSANNTTRDDVINGAGGSDTVSYASALSAVRVTLATQGNNAAQNTWGGGVDTLISIENLTGSSFNDSLTGTNQANILTGGVGEDTMVGGGGNDLYIVQAGLDHGIDEVITELANGGIDEIRYTQVGLAATVFENTLTLSSNVTGIERIVIGTGTVASGNNATGAVTTGLDALNVDASAIANAVTIIGNAGANILTSGLGNDTLIGGDGDDTYVVNNVGDVITELDPLAVDNLLLPINPLAGVDTVNVNINTAGTYVLGANVDNGTVVSLANVNLTGNDLDNILTGNAGNNVLDGGLGADTLIGGLGNDIYVLDDPLDVIQEFLDAGIDTVQTDASYVLGDDLENLTLTGNGAINGTGNALNNVIIGNAGVNILIGGLGADTLEGGAGNDIYLVEAIADFAGDVISDTAGTDEIRIAQTTPGTLQLSAGVTGVERIAIGTGTGANAVSTGTEAINVDASLAGVAGTTGFQINGNSGVNIITGSLGIDTLSGGAGNDIYMISSLATYTNGVTADRITDTGGGADQIRFAGSGALTLSANTTGIDRIVIGTGTAELADVTGVTAASINAGAVTGAYQLRGNAAANTLVGGAGDNTIIGGRG